MMVTAVMLRKLGLALLRSNPRAVGAFPAHFHFTPSREDRRRGQWKTPPEDEEFDGEEDDEVPDLEEVARALKRQKKAILLKKLKREVEPRLPVTRTLTWEAMEQIRQLKDEFPEEWTIPRLAEGFNVDIDVIKRVLHSTFSPPLAVKLKQDAKAMKTLGIPVISQGYKPEHKQLISSPENLPVVRIQPEKERQQKRISGRPTTKNNFLPNALQCQSVTSSAVMEAQKNFEVENSSWTSDRPLRNVKDLHRGKSGLSPVDPSPPISNIGESYAGKESSPFQERDNEEEWDRWVLSEEEMEYLAQSGYKSNMRVVQKGCEFFDSHGNFLYRI